MRASCSDNVEVCGSGHVVIGVRIVQCHHAIMDKCEHVVIGVRVDALSPRTHSQLSIFHFWSQFHLGPNLHLVNLFPVPTCCHTV